MGEPRPARKQRFARVHGVFLARGSVSRSPRQGDTPRPSVPRAPALPSRRRTAGRWTLRRLYPRRERSRRQLLYPRRERRRKPRALRATGTGVSPFRCFARTFPALDYRLLHGVGDASELYGREAFDPARHIACLSRTPNAGPARSDGNAFAGRVTAYLAEHPVEASSFCYLCGNSDMIYEIFAILRNQGVPRSRIFAEVYF